MLAQEGLIQIIPKKGIVVLPITMKEIAMTFEARWLLEPYVVKKYGSYIDKEKLKAIKAVSERIVKGGVKSRETAALFARATMICMRRLQRPVKINTFFRRSSRCLIRI